MKRKKRYKLNRGRFSVFLLLVATILALNIMLVDVIRIDAEQDEEMQKMLLGTPPTLTLLGDETVRLGYGEEFTEAGYTATDAYGNDITNEVEVLVPEITSSGDFQVKYIVTDKNGNETQVTRNIKVTFPPQTEEGRARGLSVLMYHYVYDPAEPPAGLNTNYITTTALEEELQYLISEGYYFPTWQEVRQYIDGEIDLPEKSVCLTFDDGKKIFEKNGVPLIEKYDVRATAFIIGTQRGDHWAKRKGEFKHLWLESHSYDMHKAGGRIGHGGIFTAMSYEDALADLKRSQEQLGSNGAFAYPYGDYTDQCLQVVRDSGFLCAFTTEYGRIYPGMDPAKLPRMRVNGSPTLDQFKTLL